MTDNHSSDNMKYFEQCYQQIKPSLWLTLKSDVKGNKQSRSAARKWIIDNPEVSIMGVCFDPFNKFIFIYYIVSPLDNRVVLFSRTGGVTWPDSDWYFYNGEPYDRADYIQD